MTFVFSGAAWFPGGATLSQPYTGCYQPLSEPCLRYLRTRLLTWSFTENRPLLCGAVSFPPFPRLCGRPMFPHSSLPCVASFPPAALPAFIGTTRLSDSLCHICLPPSSVVRHTPFFREKAQGLPGCRVITMSDMPWSSTPGKQISSCQYR